MQIIPSILVQSEDEFQKQINAIKSVVSMVQIDLADGLFVPNITWPWQHPQEAREHISMDFELHLMVQNPLQTFETWKQHPHLKRVLIHYESTNELREVIEEMLQYTPEVSIVLNPETDLNVLEPYLDLVSGIMFMGVIPGKQGQKFIPETIDRIKEFKAKYPHIPVEVDGGVNEQTLTSLIEAGVDAVCPGSAIFGNDRTPAENVKRMREIIEKLTG